MQANGKPWDSPGGRDGVVMVSRDTAWPYAGLPQGDRVTGEIGDVFTLARIIHGGS